MAGGQERVLRRRIKSVQATRKITKAMELIAASQIARAQSRIVANRPYRAGMQRIIVEAAQGDPAAAKLLATPDKVDTAVVVAIVGDRGLSGACDFLGAVERPSD
jgi:F-type H+-transporting ATPase subunit gamma